MKVATKKGYIMNKKTNYTFDLQLFSGEGDAVNSTETGDDFADAGQENQVTADDEFSQLINGKFKEQFTRKTQAIIDKRFKETKELEAYKSRVSPVMKALMEKYGVSEGEESLLLEAVDTLQEKSNAENSALPANQDRLKEKIGSWIKESEALKEKLPGFNLRKEIKENKLFSQLLLSGVPLSTAYETVHRDEIISQAMHYTADTVRQQVVQSIEAKGRRPVENGISSESAVVTSVDVNSLTSQDILKILKQVENGASIKF